MFAFFTRAESQVNIDCKHLKLKAMLLRRYGAGWAEFCRYCAWGNKRENEKNRHRWNSDFNNQMEDIPAWQLAC